MSDDSSALKPASLDLFFNAGAPSVHWLSKDPPCRLRIDPRGQRLTLSTPYDGTAPEIRGFEYVQADVIDDEDGTWSLLRVDATDMQFEAYSLLLGVTEALHGGAKFAAAAQGAVANLKLLLTSRRKLNEHQQVGLIGELLVLRSLLGVADEATVLDWWLGPSAEQHDYSFETFDAEIKTTTSERRRHMIAGAGQLQPNPGRPLWLVSIQLTRSGGNGGFSLASLVAELYGRLQDRIRFSQELHHIGWRDDDSDLYETAYILRSAPWAYLVDNDFPAITESRLTRAVSQPALIDSLSYRVDVSDLSPATPGSPLDEFLTEKDLS